MRVCLAAGGPFHIFDLARQMERLGHLTRLYTGYPPWMVAGLPKSKVGSHSLMTAVARASSYLRRPAVYDGFNHQAIRKFDEWMAARLEPCDVFHALSGFGLVTQREARRRYSALVVCDRGSAHIETQDRILAEEFDRWKLPYHPIDRRIIDREIQEYASADLIVTPSQFAMRTFQDAGFPADRLRCMPLGVDLELFRPEPQENRDGTFRVIYAGALSLQKGIPYLLEAVAGMKDSRVRLTLLGSALPEIHPFLKKYEGVFEHLGSIRRTRLAHYYSRGSVLVLPSVQDGFGMVLAQAMACGIPVIGTMNTGAPDLITDGREGFLAPIRDAEAIRERLRQLQASPELQVEMGRAALQGVKQLGGWDDYGDHAATVYREALASRAPRSAAAAVVMPARDSSAAVAAVRAVGAPLRVSISVGGKFHAFHLAEQLARRGWLSQLLTTYFNPRSNAAGMRIPRERVFSNPLPEAARLPGLLLGAQLKHWQYHKGEMFDAWASRRLQSCDFFIGWSGFSLKTFATAERLEAMKILVRGSAHILTQQRILDEEAKLFGGRQGEVDSLTVVKEMKEYERADYIAMPSEFCRKSFLEHGLPAEKLIVWPLGADTRRFSPPASEPAAARFQVLYAGEISLQKGVHYLIDAVRRLGRSDVELLLAGSVSKTFRRLVQDLPGNITLAGVLHGRALLEAFQACSTLVLPSIQDGFGQVVMQAMACGKPVIVSTNAGSSEAITPEVNGLLVPPRDPDALAAAIERLRANPDLRREMGRNALGAAHAYTWDNYGLAVENTLLGIRR